jgi:hypothetical protein
LPPEQRRVELTHYLCISSTRAMDKETKRKVREHLLAIAARLDELISLLETRIEERKQAQPRRDAS